MYVYIYRFAARSRSHPSRTGLTRIDAQAGLS